MEHIRIGLADDHPLVVEGLKSMLDSTFTTVLMAATAKSCLEQLEVIPVDVLLTDIHLGNDSGIELCKQVKARFPSVKIIGISSYDEPAVIEELLQAGAEGFLLKNAGKDEIVVAIKTIFQGGTFVNVSLKKHTQPAHNIPYITPREKQVLELIAKGLTNQEIADQLFISVTTVSSHRTNLLIKTGAANTAALVSEAFRMGLLSVSPT